MSARATALLVCALAVPSALAQDGAAALEFRGFRLAPLPAPEWTTLERNAASALFGRHTAAATHTFVAIVMSDTIPEKDLPLWNSVGAYFDFMRKLKPASLDPSRHTLLEQEYSPPLDKAPTCMRYRLRVEDRGAPQARGVALSMTIAGVSCTHPEALRTLIDVSYSERGGPAPESARMREEAERIVDSLQFTPLR